MIKTGSDFSGVGAFDQALERLNIKQNKIFACDMDKYARQTYIHNYGEPAYYPENVYERVIPEESLDIYMTSPPCQAFSLAGNRKGETDKRGILFYNSHEFIQKNKPRYFIFENVKGLLSDDNGKTFQRWLDHLGGKSINGNPVIFPHPESVPYHVYHKVLNAKDFGVPQNRERVFIIGIRDDEDNEFNFPKPFHLVKRLKDVLEPEVDEKYFLKDERIDYLLRHNANADILDKDIPEVSSTIIAGYHKGPRDVQYINEDFKIGAIRGRNPENPSDRTIGAPTEQRLEMNHNGTSNTLTSVQKDNVVVMGQLKGGKWDKTHEQNGRVYDLNGIGATLQTMQGGNQHPKIAVVKHQRTEEAKAKRRESLSKGKDSGSFADREMIAVDQEYSDTILANMNPKKEGLIAQEFKIRRLTPRECFRLMDFPDSFTWPVSDSQAYKQAGNSIVVNVLAEIIKKLKL